MSGDSHEPRTPGHVPLPPAFTQPAPRRVPPREGEQRTLPPFFGRASATPAPAAPAAEELAPAGAGVAEPAPAPPLDEEVPPQVADRPRDAEDTLVVEASAAPAPATAFEGAAAAEAEAMLAVEEGDVAAAEPLAAGAPEPEMALEVANGGAAVLEPLSFGAPAPESGALAEEEGAVTVVEPLAIGEPALEPGPLALEEGGDLEPGVGVAVPAPVVLAVEQGTAAAEDLPAGLPLSEEEPDYTAAGREGRTVAELASEDRITSEFGEVPVAAEAEPAEPEPDATPEAQPWHMVVPEAAWEPTSELVGPWEPPADLLEPQAPAEEAAPASWEPPADLLEPRAPADEAAPASWEPPEPVVAESQEHAHAAALPTPTVDEALEVAAARLETLAADLRQRGRAALDEGFSGDTLQAALCALIAGYLARRDH